MISERLAGKTDASRVDRGGVAAGGRDRYFEQAHFTKRPHELAARRIDILMVNPAKRA